MFTKQLLFALLTACGLTSDGAAVEPPPDQSEKKPPDEIEKGYIFCCQDVDPKTQTGEDCVTIAEKQIDACSIVLTCDNFTKKDGKVTCVD
jgi:hypothetical protein